MTQGSQAQRPPVRAQRIMAHLLVWGGERVSGAWRWGGGGGVIRGVTGEKRGRCWMHLRDVVAADQLDFRR